MSADVDRHDSNCSDDQDPDKRSKRRHDEKIQLEHPAES